MLKKLLMLAIVGGAILGLVAYLLVQKQRQRLQDEKEQAERQRISSDIHQFAMRHNADQDWFNHLPDTGSRGQLFSSDLEQLLIRTDGRPVLLLATVKDIGKDGGRDVLTLDGDVDGHGTIEYVLESDSDVAQRLSESHPQRFERFVLAAHIRQLRVIERPSSQDSAERVFMADGVCIDFLSTGKSVFDHLEARRIFYKSVQSE